MKFFTDFSCLLSVLSVAERSLGPNCGFGTFDGNPRLHGISPELEQPRIFVNHRAAWTAGGSIKKFLRVNRKKIDTQKVSCVFDIVLIWQAKLQKGLHLYVC